MNEIDEYYIDKSNYEKAYEVNKKKIMKSGKMKHSSKEGIRRDVAKLKHHCTFCDSDQGMTFASVKTEDDKFRELSYTCNRKPDPCRKKTVKLLLGKHVDDLIQNDRDAYNAWVDTLLKAKYDMLFDYGSKVDLKNLTGHYTDLKELLTSSLEGSNGIKNDTTVRDKLRLLENQLRSLIDPRMGRGTEFKENIIKMVALETEIQSIKHPTVTMLGKEHAFDHPYTLDDLIFYNSID